MNKGVGRAGVEGCLQPLVKSAELSPLQAERPSVGTRMGCAPQATPPSPHLLACIGCAHVQSGLVWLSSGSLHPWVLYPFFS